MSELRKIAFAYAGLLALLALTVASSFLSLHGLNASVNMAIGAAKAALIALVFMHMGREEALVRLVAAAVAVWLIILTALTLIA
ncbi:cytochrome C oxidase subunit IV family protein [Aquamicrobium soli]|jgi:cytochrome c oxidase subunit 4|uniref:Cytochrome C oxidase subunit IV family protein n=1 Tax=Aquamicrobium soli TaxID=1811518 RepID=A0ABV7K6B6_9HYPH